ncbi:MAG: hypothetical protein LBC64_10185 [Fibromonadaceae bacterium]|jgi:hypothetical protein|nr:hypothetical protein [Fibromonadaceae bacterium]
MRYFLFLAVFAIFACEATYTEPKILFGHEWNANAKTVADTTSLFKPNDVIVIQMDNGRPFKTLAVEMKIYQGESDRVLFKHTVQVKNNDTKAALKGPESKPLKVREILHSSTPGIYRVAFYDGDTFLLEKNLELVK